MTSRLSRRRRVLAAGAVVGALALTGCGLHPGQAAVVNGVGISQSRVDDLVTAACSYFRESRLSAGGGQPSTSTAWLRNLMASSLIQFAINARAVHQLGLVVAPSSVSKITDGETVPASVGSQDRALLLQFFHDSAVSELQQAIIGAHLRDPSVASTANVPEATLQKDMQSAATTKFLAAFTAKQDVVVNPRYGTWLGGKLVQTDGSLSSPVSRSAKLTLQRLANDSNSVEGLPANQVCG